MAAIMEADNITAGYGRRVIIDHQTLTIPAGKITGLIGPNGSGKSTLFNVLNGFESPMSGDIKLFGEPISQFSHRKRAQKIACLPQQPAAAAGITVSELVSYGRYCHRRGLNRLSKKDHQIIDEAITAVHLDEFKEHIVSNLSGGQRQRAFVAMTLAQDSPIMMLDEPTTYLDLTNQLDILNLLKDLNENYHKTIIVILHDLNQAAQYCDHLICLVDGEIKATGNPTDVITSDVLADIFKVRADIIYDKCTNCPQILNCQSLAGSGG
ncbi:ABC transporter ATP-binding protein [Agrilactobacillus yilanensis]|uniref:ABC transporter ATP-binding protein n=1 Tax=Agrilactobacillus yilanensis TaxID=2485997 RepID=A0ABW4J591_9LACO|nr:ABC transporter ATP-binding protein [Agrilactobacillus yilanensis]